VITPDNRPFHPATVFSPNPQPEPAPTARPRPSTSRAELTNNSGGRRLSMVRNGELSSPRDYNVEDVRRDSISSRGSWIRRLSTIPISQSNSPRSSIGPESPSLTFSRGSAAPILSNPESSPAQLPPNKLVKRATSGRTASGTNSRSGSKSQVHTLRRPATSHQRSITLQQQFRDDTPPIPTRDPVQQTSSSLAQSTPVSKFGIPESRTTWCPFFESRPTKLTKERLSGRSSDGGIQNFQSTSRRVIPNESFTPTLLKPALLTISKTDYPAYDDDSLLFENVLDDEVDLDELAIPSAEPVTKEPHKRPHRSLSMHFGSPSSWISRSGSLRGNKRNDDDRSGGKRYSSAPVSTMPGRSITSAHGPVNNRHRAIMDPTVFQRQPLTPTEESLRGDPFATSFRSRSRNSSSPLPPLSRLSSFNVDLARLGLSSSSSSAPRRSPASPALQTNTAATSFSSAAGHASPTSPPYFGSLNLKHPRISDAVDRASTLVGSDHDTKGFTSGDEDDTDFQSETVFDSLRSGATGSMRSHNTPLDSMFDESPPSINGHSKSTRLSIHDMMENVAFPEGHNRIVEEDEGMSTPVKGVQSSQEDKIQTPVRRGTMESGSLPSSPPSFCLANKDFGRLSLDEEDDEDWTRDDENMDVSNQLSPPSSSLNARRLSLGVRAALADLTHSGSPNGNFAPVTERPKSNLFDWSEPSSAEKLDYMGNSPRPKTAHVKQAADGRGGRTIGRRGPNALHIRSQSVPVVPDVTGQREHSKLTPKFGTWGLVAKGVSEDWDNDFEFENTGEGNTGDEETKLENRGMFVPPAIQASQANVVGHVGQIREVCLLVEDLKRLRILGREKDLLNGASAPLWKEAEGIIALAVPDEEDPTLSPPHSPSSIIFDKDVSDDQYHDQGPNAADIERPEAPFEVLNRHGRPTGFVYNGNTVRRRSVFSADDDIFGAGAIVNNPPTREHLRPPSTAIRHSSAKNSSEVARSVMETMHQRRSTSDPLLPELTTQSSNKMPFDTTSLRDLVHRANVLSRTLADLIRKADGRSQSPEASPHRESSPAFTRVFTDPMASSPKHLLRSESNNSILSGSIDASSSRSLGQRMHMMTVV
jgi:hypothetical protein